MTMPEILEYTDRLEKQAKAIIKETLRASWHMRGAVSIEDAYLLSSEQLETINEIVKENFEFTKETKIPFI